MRESMILDYRGIWHVRPAQHTLTVRVSFKHLLKLFSIQSDHIKMPIRSHHSAQTSPITLSIHWESHDPCRHQSKFTIISFLNSISFFPKHAKPLYKTFNFLIYYAYCLLSFSPYQTVSSVREVYSVHCQVSVLEQCLVNVGAIC